MWCGELGTPEEERASRPLFLFYELLLLLCGHSWPGPHPGRCINKRKAYVASSHHTSCLKAKINIPYTTLRGGALWPVEAMKTVAKCDNGSEPKPLRAYYHGSLVERTLRPIPVVGSTDETHTMGV